MIFKNLNEVLSKKEIKTIESELNKTNNRNDMNDEEFDRFIAYRLLITMKPLLIKHNKMRKIFRYVDTIPDGYFDNKKDSTNIFYVKLDLTDDFDIKKIQICETDKLEKKLSCDIMNTPFNWLLWGNNNKSKMKILNEMVISIFSEILQKEYMCCIALLDRMSNDTCRQVDKIIPKTIKEEIKKIHIQTKSKKKPTLLCSSKVLSDSETEEIKKQCNIIILEPKMDKTYFFPNNTAYLIPNAMDLDEIVVTCQPFCISQPSILDRGIFFRISQSIIFQNNIKNKVIKFKFTK